MPGYGENPSDSAETIATENRNTIKLFQQWAIAHGLTPPPIPSRRHWLTCRRGWYLGRYWLQDETGRGKGPVQVFVGLRCEPFGLFNGWRRSKANLANISHGVIINNIGAITHKYQQTHLV